MQRRDLLNASFAGLSSAAAQAVEAIADATAAPDGDPPRFGDAPDGFVERQFGRLFSSTSGINSVAR